MEAHVKFLNNFLDREDSFEFLQMAHLKTSAIYWSLTASILLNSLNRIYPPTKQQDILNYLSKVYKAEDGGFAGNEGAHNSHLLFTLSAVQIMIILLGRGNFPSWFKRDKTIKFVLGLQTDCGAFKGDKFGEIDGRFSYCAVAILELLNENWSEKSRNLAISFINSCQNFDGGFGAIPGSESHGGNIFCCVSALKILKSNVGKEKLLMDWLVWRQLPCGGFNGRPEKLPDVCYSWWILSSLSSLGAIDQINSLALQSFILNCKDIDGGFADRPGDVADIFHTLFGLTGLSLLNHPEVTEKIDPLYCLPTRYL